MVQFSAEFRVFLRNRSTTSPATIEGLANGTAYHIFVTATNTNATSNPSTTITATPASSSAARGPGGFIDLEYEGQRAINRAALGALAAEGVLTDTGCNPVTRTLCPSGSIRRWEVAVWLVRVMDGPANTPANTTQSFDDVDYEGADADWWAPYVERVKELGITRGCLTGPLRFCPNNKVSRGQIASFIARAFSPPRKTGFRPPTPTDIAGNTHAAAITQLLRAGIVDMCTRTTYCPDTSATREHLATLIVDARCTLPAYADNNHCRPGPGTGPGTTPANRRPGAPTRLQFTAGVDTLHVTWQPNGPQATRWRITARLEGTTGTAPVYENTNVTADPATGHTVGGLSPYTEYRIEIQGFYNNIAGSTTSRAHRTLPAVTLTALEVTQGLQNWSGDITLVKGKRTVVRAFLEPTSGAATTVNVELYAVLPDGTELEPIAPINHVGLLPEDDTPFVARPNAAANRRQLEASANFLLDTPLLNAADWIGNADDPPTDADHTVTYRLEVDQGVRCEESVAPANRCQASVDFIHVAQPRVRMVGVDTVNGSPTLDELMEQAERIKSVMPVPDMHIEILPSGLVYSSGEGFLGPSTAPATANILTRLEQAQELYVARDQPSYRWIRFLGAVAGEPASGQSRGLGNVSGEEAVWFMEGAAAESASGYMRNVGAHEFGHTLGERHSSSPFRFDGPGFVLDTMCIRATSAQFQVAQPLAARYEPDYIVLREHVRNNRVEDWAALGEVDNPELSVDVDSDTEMWGLDTRFVAPGNADWLAVLNPANVFSLMSYCNYEHLQPRYHPADSQARWVDAFFHRRFITDINGIEWGEQTSPDTSAFPSTAEVSLFAGHVMLSEADVMQSASVSPVYRYRTAAAVQPAAAGEYVLEFFDAQDAVVRSVSFAAGSTVSEPSVSGAGTAVSEVWAVPVANVPDYASYRITRKGSQVAAQARSSTAPTVAVTAPVAGQVLSGATVEFSWSGSDADGDDLSYLVQYSTDGGDSYETIALDYRSSVLRLDRSLLKGSNRARWRVVASDGSRSASAVSAVFTVAQNPPQVHIRAPATNTVYGGLRSIVLDAAAYDPEDGALADTSISWSSSIDGQLATSGQAVIDTADLTAGTHVLTATATDSASATAQAAVTITVKVANEPPDAADDASYVSAGTAVVVDVLANDIDPEDDIAAHSLAVAVPAGVGAAAATAAAATAGSRQAAVAYTAASTPGYDAIIYEVCDVSGQCATAEATIIVMSDT